ncbi:DUF397 domain-containing protein [Streptomyces niveus]|uniref:DUF397 domain-containing protein n=1 Tax=Streptomyces niveus TaxID=193462 RepID=UPI0003C5ADEE|nr:DUF397 domain-containing protein [Streptomyces niveus]EST23954.1 hypothetical protein M877_26070 [Streptomyces niveus NCIMB 11891]
MTVTTEPRWFTSSYSSNGGNCVEVAANLAVTQGVVPVRDSKSTDGPVLDIPARSFASFVAGVKAGEFGGV